jgi:hypothetical protein
MSKETINDSKDLFFAYRDGKSPSWLGIESILKSKFPDGVIPEALRNHLIELVVIKEKSRDGGLPKDIVDQFGDFHDSLFVDSLFSEAVKTITNEMAPVEDDKGAKTWKW